MNIKRILIAILIFIIIGMLYCFFLNQYAVKAFDTFMDFTDRNYLTTLRNEYENKNYDFLIREIKYNQVNFTRVGNAISILVRRNERRAIDDIINAFLDMRRDSVIRHSAATALAKFGGKKVTFALLSVVNQYKDRRFDLTKKSNSQKVDQLFNALQALSIMQNEETYPLLVSMLKEGGLIKSWVLSRCLYHYKNHWQEILPIYLEELKENPSGGIISRLKQIGRPEAIPAIKGAIKQDPAVQREAEKAIKYLESLPVE